MGGGSQGRRAVEGHVGLDEDHIALLDELLDAAHLLEGRPHHALDVLAVHHHHLHGPRRPLHPEGRNLQGLLAGGEVFPAGAGIVQGDAQGCSPCRHRSRGPHAPQELPTAQGRRRGISLLTTSHLPSPCEMEWLLHPLLPWLPFNQGGFAPSPRAKGGRSRQNFPPLG